MGGCTQYHGFCWGSLVSDLWWGMECETQNNCEVSRNLGSLMSFVLIMMYCLKKAEAGQYCDSEGFCDHYKLNTVLLFCWISICEFELPCEWNIVSLNLPCEILVRLRSRKYGMSKQSKFRIGPFVCVFQIRYTFFFCTFVRNNRNGY